MLQKYKKTLIWSSVAVLLPMLWGTLLWKFLPEAMQSHWGFSGQADGTAGRGWVVYGLPVLLLATHWFCFLFTARDPGNQGRNEKPVKLVLWLLPVLSNFTCGMICLLALGWRASVTGVTLALLGVLLLAVGNYLPKCRQNDTIGIKVPWVYTSPENWNATHRFGGRLWFLGGLAMLLLAFIPAEVGIWVGGCLLAALIFLPVGYSYRIYRRQKKAGEPLEPLPKATGKKLWWSLGALLLVLALVAVLLFTGELTYRFADSTFTVEASFYEDLTVPYAAVESVEYRAGNVPGFRNSGFGSFRLLMGQFESQELGTYTRYTYYRPEACVILRVEGKTLVLSGRDEAQTRLLYEALLQRIPK